MTVTGIKLEETLSSGAVAPQGQEFKQAYFVEDAGQVGTTEMTTIDASTVLEDVFTGQTELIGELTAAQANANSSFWAVVYRVPVGDLIGANLGTYIDDLAANYEVSTLLFLTDADAAFAGALETELDAQENQKRFYEAVLRFRKANAETPDVYATAFDTEFDGFASNRISIIAPTTQDNWVGAYGGRLARIRVQASAGKVLDGGMSGVSVDPEYGQSQFVSLDAARAVFFKRFVEDPASIYVNDDLVMHSAVDQVTTMAQRRVLNKAKREILFYAFPLINDDKFNKDASGALAASVIAAKGLEIMQKPQPGKSPEIHDFTLEAGWITGGLAIAFTLIDVNRIKIVDTTIELTN